MIRAGAIDRRRPWKRSERRTGESGFTLVELILAGSITAMVVVAAVTSLVVAMRSHAARRDVTAVYESAGAALQMIRRDLLSVFLAPVDNRTRFVGLDMEESGLPIDQLIFMSTGNNPAESMGGESDLMEVHYYIDSDDSTEERWLQRRTDATPDDDPFTGGTVSLLGPHVVALDFQYYDGLEWWEDWDSKDAIPVCVSVGIAVRDERKAKPEEEARTFTTMVWMPVYREGGSPTSGSDENAGMGEEDSGESSSNQGGGNGQPSNPGGEGR